MNFNKKTIILLSVAVIGLIILVFGFLCLKNYIFINNAENETIDNIRFQYETCMKKASKDDCLNILGHSYSKDLIESAKLN